MLCKEVMTRDPKGCSPDDTVARAAEIMKHEDVGPVPVIEDRNNRKLKGIVTDRDIAIKVVAAGNDPQSTRVRDIMSKDLVTCGPDEDYSKLLEAMADHKVRRILVVDDLGALLGIVSQADIARHAVEHEVGEVVEAISDPLGFGHHVGSMVSRSPASRLDGGFGAFTLLSAAASLAGGAAAMYLLDPDRGRSRRAKIADKTASMYRDSADFAGKVQRDARNRAAGLVASTKSMFTREDDTSDQKIEARVRAKLGRVSSHPHAIRVVVSDRSVTLQGNTLANEVHDILSAVRSTPGVHRVENRLHVQDSRLDRANWSPTARLVAGTTAVLGAGLLTWAILNPSRDRKGAGSPQYE
jgi:CBS domain-containing protein